MDECQRIRVPTPFSVGRVNCYLLTAGDVTLLDPGPATDAAYKALADGLADYGLAVADVDRILITHPHMDHFGIARRLKADSGADLHAHQDAVDRMAAPDQFLTQEQAFFRPYLRRMGVPEKTVDTVVALPDPYADYRDPVQTDHALIGGETIDVGVDLDVIHTPGHAPGSVCFAVPPADAAFTGDHVMNEITPNPLLTLRPDDPDARTRSLPTYIASLRTLGDRDLMRGYGGHRATVTDLPGRIEEILAHHEARADRIQGIVVDGGPINAYDLMEVLFPDLPVTEVFSGMSEIIGHLDLLVDWGEVTLDPDGRYRAT